MSNAEFKAYLREQAKNLISNGTIKETTTYSEIEEIFRENVRFHRKAKSRLLQMV